MAWSLKGRSPNQKLCVKLHDTCSYHDCLQKEILWQEKVQPDLCEMWQQVHAEMCSLSSDGVRAQIQL